MALANAVINGSYSTIVIDTFAQQKKVICFTVSVWQDNTKSKKLTELRYQFKGQDNVDTLPNKGINELPLNPAIGDKYMIGTNPIGEAAAFNHGDSPMWHGPENGWIKTKEIISDSVYYIEDEDVFSLWNGTSFYDIPAFFSEAIWTTYFDIGALNQEGHTILKGCYEYLKLTPEFSNTVDA